LKVDSKRTSRIFQKLIRIFPDLKGIQDSAKSVVVGYMDLNLDVLERKNSYRRIALSHYWEHESGDLIADPDMEIAVFFDLGMAEALTYQDSYSYEVAYKEQGEPPDLLIHTRINVFLEEWLGNLSMQGHVLLR
jgi:uncharacterized protein YqiB (DUF1249 family)